MGITINGKQYAAEATGGKGTNSVWDAKEVNRAAGGANDLPANYDLLSMGSLASLMNLTNFDAGTEWPLETLLEKAGDVPDTFSENAEELNKQIAEATKKLETFSAAHSELKDKLSIVEQQIKNGKGAGGQPLTALELKALNDQKTLLESALNHTQIVLSKLLSNLKAAVAEADNGNEGLENGTGKDAAGAETKMDAAKLAALKTAFGNLKQRLTSTDTQLAQSLAQSAASKPGAKAAAGGSNSAGGSSSAGGSNGANGARAAAGGGPFGQARAGDQAFPPLDMNALLMSNYMQQNQLEGTDAMHKTENESKRMMLLFFMLARMAMSGDVGAMYQFLRFIGHIVNKDKAMQNVQLARKLIELQDVSRKLTQMLVDAPAHDEEDDGVQAEYMKLQQKVQAEQGVIATSQKLIAQMLEEFTQVSEMMTGMVKSLLDARGRELSMLAVWRA